MLSLVCLPETLRKIMIVLFGQYNTFAVPSSKRLFYSKTTNVQEQKCCTVPKNNSPRAKVLYCPNKTQKIFWDIWSPKDWDSTALLLDCRKNFGTVQHFCFWRLCKNAVLSLLKP